MSGWHEEERRADGDGGCLSFASRPIKSTTNKTSRRSIDQRFRDYLARTNIDVIAIGLLLALCHIRAVHAKSEEATDEGGHDSLQDEHSDEHKEVYAILFPWFAEIVGVFVYYFLSRYAHAIPYTAVMFIIGTLIGISTKYLKDDVSSSASTWVGIEGHLILLIFLPGLLYLDSYNIDVHLFVASFVQLLTFAFPMVLAGTTLTALVAYYVFPYNWSFDLSMTFGAILAATDPVAVSVLLNELGAPPRLKIHVSGESLLNDGSAVVFFIIFSSRFLYELQLEDVGKDIGWGEGFKLFFRLSLGGACIGIAFGVGLLMILYNLNRRLSGEDSVVQVVATITTAYLVFFTSEILAQCSGIIAVVFCGIVVKAFGETLYNDSHLSHHFWEITEYLLNTLLFALGGCVWGDLISGVDVYDAYQFTGSDWGFLIALYVLITIIRFVLIFAFYPITSNTGIGTTWKEAVFMSYGGLRGAVGIALALALHAQVVHFTSNESEEMQKQYQGYTTKLFGMVGGIALLTLVINGPTSGPLLKHLGLVTPTESRKKIIENYEQHMMQHTLVEYVKLLTEERFHDVDYTVVKCHVPCLRNINYDQLIAAVKKHKEESPLIDYIKPNLKNVIPYLYGGGPEHGVEDDQHTPFLHTPTTRSLRRTQKMEYGQRATKRVYGDRSTVYDMRAIYSKSDVEEKRSVFAKILRTAYHRLIEQGEIEGSGFVFYTLKQSVDHADNAASRGLPISDWNALEVASNGWIRPAESIMHRILNLKKLFRDKNICIDFDRRYFFIHTKVRQILAFTHAHEWARKIFKREFSKAGEDYLTPAEKIVMDESDKQVQLASEALCELDETEVAMVKSQYACQILLNRSAHYYQKLHQRGLMTEREAGKVLEEIEDEINDLLECREKEYEDEMSSSEKIRRLSMIPKETLHMQGIEDVVPTDVCVSDLGSGL